MRKSVLIMILILVAVFVALNFLDDSEYPVEKKLWRVQRLAESLARDPSAVPEQEFEAIVDQYNDIMRQFPRSKMIPDISLMVGRVYGMKKDYSKAREVYEGILKNYPDNSQLKAEALRNIAMTYEMEKDTSQAIKIYQSIMINYPLTDVGLNIPLYLAKYYKELGFDQEFSASLEEATAFYKIIVQEEPDTVTGFNAHRLLVATYLAKRQWQPAVQVMEELLLNFSGKPFMTSARLQGLIKSINTICISNLKDYETPLRIYQAFLEKYPMHSSAPFVKGMMDGLIRLKDKKTQVTSEAPEGIIK